MLTVALSLITDEVHIPRMHNDGPGPCWPQVMLLHLHKHRGSLNGCMHATVASFRSSLLFTEADIQQSIKS